MRVQTDKLKLFYISNIRSILIMYAAPAFYVFLTNQEVYELKKVQRFATRLINCYKIDSYTERLSILGVETRIC